MPIKIVIFCCTIALAARANAAVPVFRIMAGHCLDRHEATYGTGFLVKQFRADQTPTVLVTALHVIHGCRDVAIYAERCQAAPPAVSEVIELTLGINDLIETWPELDLAVIVVPSSSPLTRYPTTGIIDASTGTFEVVRSKTSPTKYSIPSMATACAQGFAESTGALPATNQFLFLAKGGGEERARKLRGSLGDKVWLLTYWGTPAAGASGAPVITDGDRVIGIHEAGYTRSPRSWAILLAGTNLASLPTKRASLTSWPPFQEPFLVQRDSEDGDSRFTVRLAVGLGYQEGGDRNSSIFSFTSTSTWQDYQDINLDSSVMLDLNRESNVRFRIGSEFGYNRSNGNENTSLSNVNILNIGVRAELGWERVYGNDFTALPSSLGVFSKIGYGWGESTIDGGFQLHHVSGAAFVVGIDLNLVNFNIRSPDIGIGLEMYAQRSVVYSQESNYGTQSLGLMVAGRIR